MLKLFGRMCYQKRKNKQVRKAKQMFTIDNNGFPFLELLPKTIEVELSKNGEWILKKSGKYLYSKYNPTKEAENFANQLKDFSTIVLFGLGLGYHLLELIKQEPNRAVLIIEPNNFFITIFLKQHPCFNENKNIIFQSNPTTEDLFSFFESLELEQLKKIKVSQINSLISVFPDEYNKAKKNFSGAFRDYMTNIYTEMEFQKIWHKNTLLNFATVTINQHFNQLKNSFNHKIALLVGAGTTLSQSIKQIRTTQTKIIIFCVDTALKPLLEQKIIPDFIISLDGQKANFNDFCGADTSNTNLICDITVYPQIPKLKFKNIFYFETANFRIVDNQTVLVSDPLTLWYKQCFGELGSVRSGGNVTSSAMEIIRIMGFDQIILAGCDWGFPGIGYHCQGAPTHIFALNKSNRINSVEKISRNFYQNKVLQKALNIEQNEITTDIIMMKYAQWTKLFIAETESIKKVQTLSCKSLAIEGIELLQPAELSKTIKSINTIKRPLTLTNSKIEADKIKILYNRIKTLNKDTEELINDFSGDKTTETLNEKVLNYLTKHTYMKKIYSSQILHITSTKANSEKNNYFLLSEILLQLTKSIKYIKRTQQKLKEQL